MKKTFLSVVILLTLNILNAQVDLQYYLPGKNNLNPSVTTPKQFTGHEIGDFHLTHDKLYYYMLELDRISDRAVWEEYGKSHEGRPLGHLIISSPANIENIGNLRLKHLELSDPGKSQSIDIRNMPIFVKMGYGIHGNESSAQNASALVAYYLIAGEGPEIDEILNNTVILLDPSLNPDGMQRHSTWVNSAKSNVLNSDPASWEFSETWPGGRTNHYWFDLNRDYLMLQHPESQGRVESFYRWRPNIVTDHHETGPNETFFFQPGIQSRNNPLTPAENQLLTAEIGRYHEKHLNAIGSLYYTEESFDDYYIGKGSSYPDIHGSVGILFEQAGVKGHLRETSRGTLSFPFAIRNQVTVSLSTLEAGLKMKDKLLENQRRFYQEALTQAEKHDVKAYVFGETEDKARLNEFIKILLNHRIKIYKLAKNFTKNETRFTPENSFIIPLKQPEYRFVRSLFEPVRDFTDSTFYDTSTWVLPWAFNINYAGIPVTKEMEGLTGEEITTPGEIKGRLQSGKDPYAYLFEWKEYYSPEALYLLQDAGIKTRVASEGFEYNNGSSIISFSPGTILIPASGQPVAGKELSELVRHIAEECGITVHGVETGLTYSGIDLGSNKFHVLSKPSVMMITGPGINSTDAGEIWHMLDTRFRIPVTLATASTLSSAGIDRFNVIIVAGSPGLTPDVIEDIRDWNNKGGILIGYKSGNEWLARNDFIEIDYIPAVSRYSSEGVYANRQADRLVHQIPGSIFETRLDLTHPLCFGFSKPLLPVFKTSNSAVKRNGDIYNNPVQYTENPFLSGYCTKENLERISGSAFASVHKNKIISIYDNTNFRAFWFGTSKIFMNAVFFGQIIR